MSIKQRIEEIFKSPFPEMDDVLEAYIITPYISEEFIESFCRVLNPKKFFIIADKDISQKKLLDIKEKTAKHKTTIKIASADGLMHAKIYWLAWKNAEGHRHYTLYWGSCNATISAFLKNAETVAWYHPINKKNQTLLRGYFKNLSSNTGQAEHIELTSTTTERSGEKKQFLSIHLPKLQYISLSEKKETFTFDSWLQKGYLAHKRESKSNFLKIQCDLQEALPLDRVEKIFQNHSFKKEGSSETIYYRYAADFPYEEEEKTNEVQWKAKFFIETALGHWCSDDCYEKQKQNFVQKNSKQRHSHIDVLKTMSSDAVDKIVGNFINSINNLAKELIANNFLPQRYFKCVKQGEIEFYHQDLTTRQTFVKQGEIDEFYYRDLATRQIRRDQEKASIHWFSNGYISGYDFIKLPAFKNSEEDWDLFVYFFCEQLLYLIKQNKVQNNLAQAIKKELKKENSYKKIHTGKMLMTWIRENWKRISNHIENYHNDKD